MGLAHLGAEAVPSAGGLLLVVVEVRAREQVAEDELGHVHVVLLVHLNRDALAVVPHRDAPVLGVDRYLRKRKGAILSVCKGGTVQQ